MSTRAELFIPFIAGIETAINSVLALDPATLKSFASFKGKVIAIELESRPKQPLITLYLLPGESGMIVLSQYAGEPDTTLAGTPIALAKMSFGSRVGGPDASDVLFSGEVNIRGDVELGQHFKRVLDKMDIDWEEHLSKITGDIVAYKVGDSLRQFGNWWKQSAQTLGEDAAEFLQQENARLPEKSEMMEFNQSVDTIRDDVERLQARIQRLQTDSAKPTTSSAQD
ncbi:MAG: SCP2 sterol-binding domain-containing protein [Gammaproteobacteria bacterium]|nr:SCP2 sterol-binding domain-containing protein [Gammaproteobacteria bacterium]